MKYPVYERYKDSEVAWLGEVPEHWDVVRFSFFIGFQEGPGIMAVDFRDEGVPLLRIKNQQRVSFGYISHDNRCKYW